MKNFTIFRKSDGEIVGALSGGDYEAQNNIPEGCAVLPGLFDHRIYVVKNGVAIKRATPLVDFEEALRLKRDGDPKPLEAYFARVGAHPIQQG